MWTPRPVRPLRYAGSVATSVLPSPVAISAILPSWRTMPPISWTSKGRMPTVRRAASRATANASGSSASTDSPASRRFLNSSVFARSSASPSAWTVGSTVGIMRLTSRSCLVPKIFRRIASIITIDYGISRDSRPPFARSGRAEQLARVAARGVGDPLAREHARDLLDAGVAGEPLEGDARAPRADGLGHAHVVAGARGDRREVGHAEHLTTLRDRRELLCDDRGDTSTDARVHLVEDHRRHAVRLRQHGRQPEHRARELAARRHARERPHVLARIGREPELDPLEPPGRHPLELRPFQPDPEVEALHAERAQLPLHGGPQTLRRGPPPLGERRGRLPELGLELAEPPLLGREDLLVAREPVELGDDLVAELEHRLLGIAVFPLEARERVEPLVDRLQAGGLERHRLAERSDRREGVFELRPSRVDRLDGRRHRGIETRQVAEDARRAVEPRGRRLVIVVEERRDLGQTRGELVGVLESSTLLPELLLLARTQARGVELGELEAQEVLALAPVALGGARPLRLGARLAELRHEARHALPELLRVGEAIQELELAGGLEQALVLVLAVHLHEVVAQPLEERDGDGRVVDERTMAARATELTPRHQHAFVGREPRLVERRGHGAARLDVEDRLDRRGVGVAPDHVRLGARPEDQQDRVDEHRLSGAGFAGQDVEPRAELHGDALDDGEVSDAK